MPIVKPLKEFMASEFDGICEAVDRFRADREQARQEVKIISQLIYNKILAQGVPKNRLRCYLGNDPKTTVSSVPDALEYLSGNKYQLQLCLDPGVLILLQIQIEYIRESHGKVVKINLVGSNIKECQVTTTTDTTVVVEEFVLLLLHDIKARIPSATEKDGQLILYT